MEDFEQEVWKDVVGYEGLYKVNNLGKVIKLGKNIRFMTPCKDRCGYLFIRLTKNGKRKTKMLHDVIGEAFIPNPNNLPEINHKDENKLNNNLDNLEWCNRQYNNNYGTRTQRASQKAYKKVYKYDTNMEFIKEYNSVQETLEDNFEPKHVSDCALGKRKTHKGFIWSYTPLHITV